MLFCKYNTVAVAAPAEAAVPDWLYVATTLTSEVPISIKFPIWDTSEVAKTLACDPAAKASANLSSVVPSPKSIVLVVPALKAVVTSKVIWKIWYL